MLEFLRSLTDTSDFPARWYCGRWSDAHGWLHITSDVLIFLAYMAIPVLLLAVYQRRGREVPFPRLLALFSLFVLCCGVTHLVEAVIFWKPMYRLAGMLKLSTAIVSWVTVAALVPAVPRMLAMRFPEALETEATERTQALAARQVELEEVQRQLESANARLRGKRDQLEQIVYTMSHDLKAPVVSVQNYMDIATADLRDGRTDDALNALQRGEQATQRALQMIASVLTTSRAGLAPLKWEEVDLDDLVEEVGQGLGVPLEIPEPLGRVVVDPARFQDIIENIISNASKYGRPPVTVEIARSPGDFTLCLSDGGAGVPPERREQIFSLFSRLAGSETPGDGIGLTIVRRTAQAHGGWAHMEATDDGGARIVVRIPTH